ncbi:MAG TPA: nucleoside hydrolase [Opitutaceae bacterium]|jgi:inosine-uridine nucleoside N-ribohydrolase|nr:nucleoside hydrolase [Opitutaceae bacterium]
MLRTLAFVGIMVLASAPAWSATPVVLVTDIGTDIDDSWALALALRSPDLDLKLVVTDPADTLYRAKVAAKLLEAAGRSDVPIALGDNSGTRADDNKTLDPWVAGFDLRSYPGRIDSDGVSALVRFLRQSTQTVTVIAIGPAHSLAIALRRDPSIAAHARLVGMFGSFDHGYGGGPPGAEFNVKVDPAGLRTVLAAPWRDILLTPLDTCGLVALSGARYHAIWSATHDPLLRALIGSYCIFAPRQNWMTCDYFPVRSTTLYDTVAVYLAYSEDLVAVEPVAFDVTADGRTVRSAAGPFHARIALRWKNEDGFEAQTAGRLLGP